MHGCNGMDDACPNYKSLNIVEGIIFKYQFEEDKLDVEIHGTCRKAC